MALAFDPAAAIEAARAKFDVREVYAEAKSLGRVRLAELAKNLEALSRTRTGDPCGVRKLGSRGEGVFVDEAAEAVAALDGGCWWLQDSQLAPRRIGRLQVERAVRPVRVGVVDEDAHHAFEVASVHASAVSTLAGHVFPAVMLERMPAVGRAALDLDQRPILVFWETTKACALACRHCRASAIWGPLRGELTTADAARFVDSLAGFGMPRPVLVATGGDVLMRQDLDAMLERARRLKVPVALAPSVTPLLTDGRVAELHRAGVRVVSISLDGATPATHDGVRGVEGHFAETVAALRRLREGGLTVQVNTVVIRDTVEELPAIARIVKESGASIWEVFFLVRTGRGRALGELTPAENEDVCHFLVDASRYGFVVRTVEAPFFRRVVALRKRDLGDAHVGATYGLGPLYEQLAAALGAELGRPTSSLRAQTKGTRDGRGIVFVGHDGEIHPSGFLPLSLGNVRHDEIVRVYREHPLLRRIRAADFGGRCGSCPYRELCGGSRARAYASVGDPLAEDPACAYQPV